MSDQKIKKVLLIFPPARLSRETMKEPSLPLGVSYLAAMIKNEVEVEIMDAVAESDHEHDLPGGFSWLGAPLSEIRKRIEQAQPDLVGVTCLFSSIFPVVREVCQEVKKISPEIVTITGGTYPTFLPEYALGEPALDLVALGEGEDTLLTLIRRLNSGQALAEMDGLAFRDRGTVRVNPKTRWIEDLDAIPFPARELLPMHLYLRDGIPHSLSISGRSFATMITSRGCPAHCIYCSSTRFWGNHHRFRSPKNVLDEIGELISRFGIEEIQFEDDNLAANKERAKAIFRGIIERGYKIKFNFPNGVALWTLDEELVDLIAAAGCYEMTLAYESGCQEVLRNIVKKPLNLQKARQITAYVRSKKIRTDAFFILGFPGETREQIQETIQFAREMKTNLTYFFIANPLPGSEMFETARERGLLPPDFNFENLSYAHSPYREGVFKKNELETTAIRAFLELALRSFLREPRVFFRRFFRELLFKRPRFTLGILKRIWRRTFGR